MDYKVGDKVKMVGNDMNWELWFIVERDLPSSDLRTVEMFRKVWNNKLSYSVPKEYVPLASDTYRSMYTDEIELVEQTKIKNVVTKPTYERKAERSDGVVFEKTAIWWRTLKEIEESIKERKDSIKADEQLLRSHRSLFSKKS